MARTPFREEGDFHEPNGPHYHRKRYPRQEGSGVKTQKKFFDLPQDRSNAGDRG
jgi:hypothetical protein